METLFEWYKLFDIHQQIFDEHQYKIHKNISTFDKGKATPNNIIKP